MDSTLAQKAIDLALEGSWEEACSLNLQILEKDPQDTDALNRLARAQAELGDIKEARKIAERVLGIDPVNSIASKCLEKWRDIKKIEIKSPVRISSETFLEEPGKTRLIPLLFIGDEKLFANLDPGEEVKLSPHAHRVSVVTNDQKYLGRLPDDIAARLRNLIKGGNKYQVLIKSIKPREITVFIREVEKGKMTNGAASFPSEKIDYVSFTPPELVHDAPPISIGEDLEEAEGTI